MGYGLLHSPLLTESFPGPCPVYGEETESPDSSGEELAERGWPDSGSGSGAFPTSFPVLVCSVAMINTMAKAMWREKGSVYLSAYSSS